MTTLEKRCIELSYKNGLSHLSSVLNAVEVIADIYERRFDDEPFVLGQSHAALALFVVLESKGLCDAQDMINRHGTHAARDMEHGVWVSGGSLGQAETVAVGLAMADPNRKVWLVTSDGACMEGSVYEAFRTAERYCTNLEVRIILNHRGAYGWINEWELPGEPSHFVRPDELRFPEWLQGTKGHYLKLNQEQYEELMK